MKKLLLCYITAILSILIFPMSQTVASSSIKEIVKHHLTPDLRIIFDDEYQHMQAKYPGTFTDIEKLIKNDEQDSQKFKTKLNSITNYLEAQRNKHPEKYIITQKFNDFVQALLKRYGKSYIHMTYQENLSNTDSLFKTYQELYQHDADLTQNDAFFEIIKNVMNAAILFNYKIPENDIRIGLLLPYAQQLADYLWKKQHKTKDNHITKEDIIAKTTLPTTLANPEQKETKQITTMQDFVDIYQDRLPESSITLLKHMHQLWQEAQDIIDQLKKHPDTEKKLTALKKRIESLNPQLFKINENIENDLEKITNLEQEFKEPHLKKIDENLQTFELIKKEVLEVQEALNNNPELLLIENLIKIQQAYMNLYEEVIINIQSLDKSIIEELKKFGSQFPSKSISVTISLYKTIHTINVLSEEIEEIEEHAGLLKPLIEWHKERLFIQSNEKQTHEQLEQSYQSLKQAEKEILKEKQQEQYTHEQEGLFATMLAQKQEGFDEQIKQFQEQHTALKEQEKVEKALKKQKQKEQEDLDRKKHEEQVARLKASLEQAKQSRILREERQLLKKQEQELDTMQQEEQQEFQKIQNLQKLDKNITTLTEQAPQEKEAFLKDWSKEFEEIQEQEKTAYALSKQQESKRIAQEQRQKDLVSLVDILKNYLDQLKDLSTKINTSLLDTTFGSVLSPERKNEIRIEGTFNSTWEKLLKNRDVLSLQLTSFVNKINSITILTQQERTVKRSINPQIQQTINKILHDNLSNLSTQTLQDLETTIQSYLNSIKDMQDIDASVKELANESNANLKSIIDDITLYQSYHKELTEVQKLIDLMHEKIKQYENLIKNTAEEEKYKKGFNNFLEMFKKIVSLTQDDRNKIIAIEQMLQHKATKLFTTKKPFIDYLETIKRYNKQNELVNEYTFIDQVFRTELQATSGLDIVAPDLESLIQQLQNQFHELDIDSYAISSSLQDLQLFKQELEKAEIKIQNTITTKESEPDKKNTHVKTVKLQKEEKDHKPQVEASKQAIYTAMQQLEDDATLQTSKLSSLKKQIDSDITNLTSNKLYREIKQLQHDIKTQLEVVATNQDDQTNLDSKVLQNLENNYQELEEQIAEKITLFDDIKEINKTSHISFEKLIAQHQRIHDSYQRKTELEQLLGNYQRLIQQKEQTLVDQQTMLNKLIQDKEELINNITNDSIAQQEENRSLLDNLQELYQQKTTKKTPVLAAPQYDLKIKTVDSTKEAPSDLDMQTPRSDYESNWSKEEDEKEEKMPELISEYVSQEPIIIKREAEEMYEQPQAIHTLDRLVQKKAKHNQTEKKLRWKTRQPRNGRLKGFKERLQTKQTTPKSSAPSTTLTSSTELAHSPFEKLSLAELENRQIIINEEIDDQKTIIEQIKASLSKVKKNETLQKLLDKRNAVLQQLLDEQAEVAQQLYQAEAEELEKELLSQKTQTWQEAMNASAKESQQHLISLTELKEREALIDAEIKEKNIITEQIKTSLSKVTDNEELRKLLEEQELALQKLLNERTQVAQELHQAETEELFKEVTAQKEKIWKEGITAVPVQTTEPKTVQAIPLTTKPEPIYQGKVVQKEAAPTIVTKPEQETITPKSFVPAKEEKIKKQEEKSEITVPTSLASTPEQTITPMQKPTIPPSATIQPSVKPQPSKTKIKKSQTQEIPVTQQTAKPIPQFAQQASAPETKTATTTSMPTTSTTQTSTMPPHSPRKPSIRSSYANYPMYDYDYYDYPSYYPRSEHPISSYQERAYNTESKTTPNKKETDAKKPETTPNKKIVMESKPTEPILETTKEEKIIPIQHRIPQTTKPIIEPGKQREKTKVSKPSGMQDFITKHIDPEYLSAALLSFISIGLIALGLR